jgi:hypothetical protein
VGRPIPSDYDGKADLATCDSSSTNYYIRYSSNGQTKQYASFFDQAGSQYLPTGLELPGDSDGDGKVDPATSYVTSDGYYTYYNVVYQSSVPGLALLSCLAAHTPSEKTICAALSSKPLDTRINRIFNRRHMNLRYV